MTCLIQLNCIVCTVIVTPVLHNLKLYYRVCNFYGQVLLCTWVTCSPVIRLICCLRKIISVLRVITSWFILLTIVVHSIVVNCGTYVVRNWHCLILCSIKLLGRFGVILRIRAHTRFQLHLLNCGDFSNIVISHFCKFASNCLSSANNCVCFIAYNARKSVILITILWQ